VLRPFRHVPRRKPNDESRPVFRAAYLPLEARLGSGLFQNPVRPLPLALGRFNFEAKLLCHLPAHEPANAVIPPVGGFGDLGEDCDFLAAEQVEDDRGCWVFGFNHPSRGPEGNARLTGSAFEPC
jgi:hypothetical protein